LAHPCRYDGAGSDCFRKAIARSHRLDSGDHLAHARLFPPHLCRRLFCGYYSYIWAEVLDADAFEAFKENGLFDSATARAFRTHILAAGGTNDPMQLYKNSAAKSRKSSHCWYDGG
jgi:peptidyl-dipeptidase Dcp